MTAMEDLIERAQELADIGAASAVLAWDQETMMPAKAIASRAFQLATLQGIYHERLTHPATGDLVARLSDAPPSVLSATERAMVRELKRERDRAVKVPTELVKRVAEAASRGIEIWRHAREISDFGAFQPALSEMVELKKQVADCVGYEGTPYNALLDEYEPGLTQTQTAEVFAGLRVHTVRLLGDLQSSFRSHDRAILERRYDPDRQLSFTVDVLKSMGYDFQAGRQDLSTHPFTTSFHPQDVRITTRVQERDGASALMGSIHEGGHALYEQGIALALARTPLGSGTSLGIHESQSRLWENFVGRSDPFWEYFYPQFKSAFPDALGDVERDDFLRALNVVSPSLIRVEADEVTYNLHIILRFEIESMLFGNDARVADLPDIWNTKMRDYLGIVPTTAADGVLQDIHWSFGALGYFPTYALGNLYAAQLYATLRKQFPDFDDRLRSGDLVFLREWLRDNIHQFGRTYTASELIVRVTGEPLNPTYLTTYLRTKYGELYGL